MNSVASLGVVGNGATDDTAAMQAVAAAGGAWSIPGGATIRLTAPVVIDRPLMLLGGGAAAYAALNEAADNQRGPGSWFHLDHGGVGFLIHGTVGPSSGMSAVRFMGCGTFRNQPAPGNGWAPHDHGWDFDVVDADLHLAHVVALNPTRFLRGNLSRGGRLRLDGVVAQPFTAGIEIDNAYDTALIDARFWPYRSLHPSVIAWTLAHLTALRTFRVDGLHLRHFFSFGHRRGWLVDASAAGTANYASADFCYLDNGTEGLIVSSASSGATIHASHLLIHGRSGDPNSRGLLAAGTGLRLTCGQLTLDDFGGFGGYIGGTQNRVTAAHTRLKHWGHSGAGVQGIVVDGAGNILRRLAPMDVVNLGGRPLTLAINGGQVV